MKPDPEAERIREMVDAVPRSERAAGELPGMPEPDDDDICPGCGDHVAACLCEPERPPCRDCGGLLSTPCWCCPNPTLSPPPAKWLREERPDLFRSSQERLKGF